METYVIQHWSLQIHAPIHWCVQELVDCSALASHYQLIKLQAHTVCMYTLSTYVSTYAAQINVHITELVSFYAYIYHSINFEEGRLIHRCTVHVLSV